MSTSRKVTLKKQKERREQPYFTPNDIVLAIKSVEAAGLKVYGVEITLTGAVHISTQPPPHQALTDTQTGTNPSADQTRPVKKQA
jgi:hypothetical protein